MLAAYFQHIYSGIYSQHSGLGTFKHLQCFGLSTFVPAAFATFWTWRVESCMVLETYSYRSWNLPFCGVFAAESSIADSGVRLFILFFFTLLFDSCCSRRRRRGRGSGGSSSGRGGRKC